jgi:glc operon protein GlcG
MPAPLPAIAEQGHWRLPPTAFAAYCARRAPRRVAEEALQMFRMLALACAFAISAGSAISPALAQQPAALAPATTAAATAAAMPPYGPPITLDQAKRAMAAAELEAAKNAWQVAIAILDSGGNLVMFHKIDNAQLSAISGSEGKARTALQFKRPSKALDDAIAAGGAGWRLLALKDITPLEGGLPVVVGGKIIGAIGVSGALSAQDAQIAKAGTDALAK